MFRGDNRAKPRGNKLRGTFKEKLQRTERLRIETLKEKNNLDAAIRRAIKCFIAEPIDYEGGMIELYKAIGKNPLKWRIRREMTVNR